jgi:CubicO group peptidase (beta-lactamase class C family)
MDLAAAVADGLRPRVTVACRPIPRSVLADRMAESGVPAVSAAVLDGGRISAAAWGASAETLFQAQSISKPLTTMALLRLASDGVVPLDVDVNDLLRRWQLPEGAGVTPRRIVSHAAGLNVHGLPGYEPGAPIPSTTEILDGIAPANTEPIRVVRTPGTTVEYSGGGFVILQALLEDITGMPFAPLMRTVLLDPLEMTHSTYEQPLPVGLESAAAVGYDSAGKPLPGGWRVQPEQAAGGLWTTPTDLVRAAAEMCTPAAVLDVATRDAMLTPQLGDRGLGWVLDGRWFRHGGDNDGFVAVVVGSPSTGQAAAVMANTLGAYTIEEDLLATIAEQFKWPDYLIERPTVALEPALLSIVAGHYEFEPGFDVVIRRDGDCLFLSMPGLIERELFAASRTELFRPDLDSVFRSADSDTLDIEFADGHKVTARRKGDGVGTSQ